ncbi:glycosyltransferase family 4 protein [Mucilaginibacter calamicampi]|uniref:Glycosyltransferase family 4 protein n=1 Tax=Mucilaginibacter calamicampi TaxID=1302352 RepID=A0ABW2YST8_9SPHI
MKKLAIIVTHPIQYYAPVFKLLHQRKKVQVEVFYTWGEQSADKFDPGFGRKVEWDIPLTEGYPHQWVGNTAIAPGSHHFRGVINPGLIGSVESYAPDAVLVFGWAYQSHLKLMRYFKGKIPVFFRGDSTLMDETTGIKSLIKYLFLKWVYSHVDHAFYVGKNNKAYFRKYGLPESALTFAPHAVDNERFAIENHQAVSTLRNQIGVGDNDILVLFAGKLEEKKHPILLAQAFIDVNFLAAHLLFVGNGELENQLKTMARGRSNIHFLDFKNQQAMPSVYQACDLFCLPSKGPGETWGLSVNEAMACSKAILASDKVGCAADLVQSDVNGAVFKSNEIKSLIAELTRLIRSKSTLLTFGKNSHKIIQQWNFTEIAKAIENKLNETI